jgi:hypothetical protein
MLHLLFCKISCSHDSGHEVHDLLGYDLYSGRRLLLFQRNVLSPSSKKMEAVHFSDVSKLLKGSMM